MNKPLSTIPLTLTLLSLSPVTVAGGNNHLYGAEFETISTSSDFERQTLEATHGNTAAGESGLGVSVSYHRLEDGGIRYRAKELRTHIGAQINQTVHIDGGVGTAQVKARYGDQREDLITYHAGTRINVNDQNSIGIRHNRDFAYKDQILSNGAGKILTVDTTVGDIRLRPNERLRIEGETTYRELSDGNHSRHYKVGAYYGISPGWPWVWAGIEADKLDYEYQDDGYWTPENHRSIAATFSSSFAVNESMNLSTSASLSRSKQEGSDEMSTGYYIGVGSDIKLSPNSRLSTGAHYIKSSQDSAGWNEKGANIGLTFNHF